MLIDEYMILNVSVSGAVSYLLPIEVRRVMSGRFDVWATIVDAVSRIPEYHLWDNFYDHDTNKLVHLEDVEPVAMAPVPIEDVVSASVLRMLPMVQSDGGDGMTKGPWHVEYFPTEDYRCVGCIRTMCADVRDGRYDEWWKAIEDGKDGTEWCRYVELGGNWPGDEMGYSIVCPFDACGAHSRVVDSEDRQTVVLYEVLRPDLVLTMSLFDEAK